jgi:predicted ATPase/class 3 adenylate cyclase
MAQPPTGTITFLFTDIEGSTRLVQELGSRWGNVFETHQRLLRTAFAAHEGIERGTEGDSFLVVFAHAGQAVAAVVDAQRALAAADWPSGVAIRVRMGLHVGDAWRGGDDYIGLDIHRAARIAAAAHGGQVLMSESTRALVERELPPNVSIRDLGEHRLKDLDRPERLYQLVIAELRSDFPPVRSAGAAGHLPTETTSFVGREREISEVADLLAAHRLVTITGPGGAGKTRLAIRVARAVAGRFGDGTWFVPLSTVSRADEMPSATAGVIGVRAAGGSLADALRDHMRTRELLLVLDNLEQISESGQVVSEFLAEAPSLRILATGRAPLRASGEQEYAVSSLGASDSSAHTGPDEIARSDAVRLFIERARLVRPALLINDQGLADIAEICRRVDGLPLAIELAAARSRLFSPGQILQGLGRRLDTLVGGPVGVPDRQKSMRGAIAWSHDLLTVDEQVVFRRLGVLVGGWDLEAADALVSAISPAAGLADRIPSLVEQSLVQAIESPDEPRFGMLETIGEYALERLEEAGEVEPTRRAHAEYFADLAERIAPSFRLPDVQPVMDRLERDIGNFRAALRWSLEGAHAETGLRVAGALREFWLQRSHMDEARRTIVELLEHPPASDSPAAARAIMTAGSLASWQGDYVAALHYGEQALAVFRERDDQPAIVEGLGNLAYALILDDPSGAMSMFEEVFAIFQNLNDRAGLAGVYVGLGATQLRLGDLPAARRSVEVSLKISREIDERYYIAFALSLLGRIEMAEGDLDAAERFHREGIRSAEAARSTVGVSVNVWALASVAVERGNAVRGARLAAAAAQMMDELGGSMRGPVAGTTDVLALARTKLDPASYEQAVTNGRRMTIDAAIGEALVEWR